MTTAAIAVFVVFPILLIGGVWAGELRLRTAAVFAILCLVLRAIFVALGWSAQFIIAVSLLDIILILMIFKGDVRIR